MRLRADRNLAVAIVAIVIALLPFIVPSFSTFELTYVGAYAIAILGLIVLTGMNGQISLGHGAFLAVGGYVVAILAHRFGLSFWLSIPIAAIVSGIVGIGLGFVALRLEGVYLALATFSLAVATPSILKRFGDLTGGVMGIVLPPVAAPKVLAGVLTPVQWFYYVTWAFAGVLFLVTARFLGGRVGRSLRALRDNEIAAVSFGVNPHFYKTLAFGWSAAFAGIAGALIAIPTAYVSPDSYSSLLSITLLIGAVLGGIDTMWGALAGGVMIEFLPLWVQKINNAAPSVVYGVALILVMLVMPGGIAGTLLRLVQRRPPAPGDAVLRRTEPTRAVEQ
jgi:branched-chain amino acid transport system permease protein